MKSALEKHHSLWNAFLDELKELQELKSSHKTLVNQNERISESNLNTKEALKESEKVKLNLLEDVRNCVDYYERMAEALDLRVKIKPAEDQTCEVIYTFDEGKGFVIFSFEPSNAVLELLEIKPPHPNFDHIKEFFQSSCDLTGLLTASRRYFNSLSTSA